MENFTKAIQESGVAIVPQQVVSLGNDSGQNTNIFEALLGLLLTDKLGIDPKFNKGEVNKKVEEIKEQLLNQINQENKNENN